MVRTVQHPTLGMSVHRLLRRCADPSVALLLTQLVAAAAAAVVNILAARALDPSERGVLALLLQVAYLSSQGLLLGTDRSIVATYHGEAAGRVVRAHARLLLVPMMIGIMVVGVLVVVPLAGLTTWRSAILVTALFTIVNAFVRSARAVAIATGRQREYVCLVLANQMALVGMLGALYLGRVDDVTYWMLGYLLAGSLPTLVYFAAHLMGRAPEAVDDRPRRRAVRREGLTLLPAAVANMGMLRADRLVLPALSSTAALGIYASVATMTELLTWPVQAYADSRLGIWRAAHDRGQLAVGRIIAVAVGYSVVAGVVLGLVTHALVVPLFGEGYEPARALVAPLVLAAGVYGVGQVGVTLLIARRRSSMASATEGAGFALSMTAYLVLIPPLGAMGAAYGSILGYGTSLLVACVVLFRGRHGP